MDFGSRLTIENPIWVIFETDTLNGCLPTKLIQYVWPTCLQVSYFKGVVNFYSAVFHPQVKLFLFRIACGSS